MENRKQQQPIPEALQDEQLDAIAGGFTNSDHMMTMEPGVIKPGTDTVEPGKIIPGVTALEPGVGIDPYVMEPNFTLAPSELQTR